MFSYTCTQNHGSPLCAALLFVYNLKDSTKRATKIKEAKKEEKEGYLLLWPVSLIAVVVIAAAAFGSFGRLPLFLLCIIPLSACLPIPYSIFDLALSVCVCMCVRACIRSIRSIRSMLLLLYCGSSFVVHFGLLLFVDDGRRRKCNSSVKARDARRRNNFFSFVRSSYFSR